MGKRKITEEKVYNSSDLSFGIYIYRYLAYYNGAEYDITGLRRGILKPTDNGYIDLVTNFIISDSDVMSKKEFGVKDVSLANSQVINIFKGVENDGYLATESVLNIGHPFDKIITFKASNATYGYPALYPNMHVIINDVDEKSFIKKIFERKKH